MNPYGKATASTTAPPAGPSGTTSGTYAGTTTGAFTTPDTITRLADPANANNYAYAYAADNPTNNIDPIGSSSSSASLCLIGCISFASGSGGFGDYSFSTGFGVGSPGISFGYSPDGEAAPSGVSAEYECGVGPLVTQYNTLGEGAFGVGLPSEESPECSATTYFTGNF